MEYFAIAVLFFLIILKRISESDFFGYSFAFASGFDISDYGDATLPRKGIWENLLFIDPSKTEMPTGKKLADARKKGQVPKSPDLISAGILMVGVILLLTAGDYGMRIITEFFAGFLQNYVNFEVTDSNVIAALTFAITEYMKIVALLFVIIMISGITLNLAQTGFLFTTDPLKPKFSKLNPISGFKNLLFTKKALFNLLKSIAKCLIAGAVAFFYILNNLDKILMAPGLNIVELYPFMKDILIGLCFQVALVMIVIGVVDFIFQKYDHKQQLRMTKHEVKEEFKQAEGDPQIKGKRKQKQMQMAMNRMLSAMNTATVVVTNPEHLAIAIKYEDGVDDVPVIIAKGSDFLASKIRELAKEHKIPIIENKPLARALFPKVEVGDIIPADFFKAIAEILVQVMKLKKTG